MLCKQRLTAVFLVQVRGELAYMPAVNAVLLHRISMFTLSDFIVISSGKKGFFVCVFSYCSTFNSHFYGYMDCLQCVRV